MIHEFPSIDWFGNVAIKTRSSYPKKLRKLLKKLLHSILPIDSETQDMAIETRTLLYHIQQDVNTYIKILNQIEKQSSIASSKLADQQPFEKNTGAQKTKDYDELPSRKQPMPSSKYGYDDVEAEIDKLFETLSGKNT